MAAGVGQVGGVGVEVLAAAAAVVLRAEQDDVARPAGEGVTQVVEGAADDPIAGGAVTAPRAGPPPVVAAADADLGLGQVLGSIDTDRRVGAIFARSWHGVPPERMVLPGDTLDHGKMFIVPARFPCYRLSCGRSATRACGWSRTPQPAITLRSARRSISCWSDSTAGRMPPLSARRTRSASVSRCP